MTWEPTDDEELNEQDETTDPYDDLFDDPYDDLDDEYDTDDPEEHPLSTRRTRRSRRYGHDDY